MNWRQVALGGEAMAETGLRSARSASKRSPGGDAGSGRQNLLAEPRENPESRHYPAVASLVAKLRGANHPQVPAYFAFMRSRSHLAFGGYLGKQYDPFLANEAARLPVYDLVGKDTGKLSGGRMFELPADVPAGRMGERQSLLKSFDRLRADIDTSGAMAGMMKGLRSR